MKTLLQKLKPSIKSSIEKNKLEYNKSVESIFKKLDNTFFYSDLTISDIDLIYTFAGFNFCNSVFIILYLVCYIYIIH